VIKKFCIVILLLGAELTLLALGTWQVYRLNYKTDLIQSLTNQLQLPPIEKLQEPITYYRQVNLSGQFLIDKTMYMYNLNKQGKPGYNLIIPFKLRDNKIVLVKYSWVKDKNQNIEDDLPSIIKGVIMPVEGKSKFIPENELERNQWYYINLSQMERFTGLNLLPIIINTDINPDDLPLSIRNDHLGYAIIWYALAAIGAIIIFIKSKSAKAFTK
jgi:surfeit locus 1 family protein